jgi:hypothetical protein
VLHNLDADDNGAIDVLELDAELRRHHRKEQFRKKVGEGIF